MGISDHEETVRHHQPQSHTLAARTRSTSSKPHTPNSHRGKMEWGLTNLDREARRQAQGNEIPELGKKCIADSHEINDGGHLLTQGQGMLLTQPQLGLEPAPHTDPKG